MVQKVTRRQFLKRSAALGAGAALVSAGLTRPVLGLPRLDVRDPDVDLAIARGPSPAANALAAVEALGGFRRFIREGDRVVIKPNPLGTCPPEMGICTHPDILEAVVRECYRAGAAEVLAVSKDDPRHVEGSGNRAAVERAGGTFKIPTEASMFREVIIPRGTHLRKDRISVDVLEADVFINMPIAKHHIETRVTFSMKNLMGITWDPIRYHRIDLEGCIAEAATAVDHSLIILDANHVLLSNGPMGPGRVEQARQVIAGVDPVAVDSAAMRFFRTKPRDVRHIRTAYELGAGEIDLSRLNIREIDV